MSRKKRSKKGKKTKSKIIKISIIICLLLAITTIIFFSLDQEEISTLKLPQVTTKYLASDSNLIKLYTLKETTEEEPTSSSETEPKFILEEQTELPRGEKVKAIDTYLQYEDLTYQKISIDNKDYYVEKKQLVTNQEDVVLENTINVRSSTSVLKDTTTSEILTLATKGEALEVLSYDKIDEEGNVNFYQVKTGEETGYIYGKYTCLNQEEALQNYQAATYDPIHSKVANNYGGGEAIKLDFYPNEKPQFTDNIMPDAVYALYLNAGSNTIKNIDAYIAFAKETKINAFVVDIKDNESPAYPAKVFQTLSPTNYQHAINDYDTYKQAITKLKEAGFYVIGRITVFKDSYYVTDHPENAIMNKSTNQPYLHNGSYWPSAYDRDVWYYNVALAKEAVLEFGFNEINFDYVRFPDRMTKLSDQIDLKNTYNEDKVEAIQRFVQYAKDVLHELNTYVSIDVFGETTNSSYTTAYGQYWPAISNVADVISGMPYPDHFSNGSYGLQKPWNQPYQLMKYWASYAADRQQETPTPAKVRTWIQAYDVMKYVDPSGITYGATQLEEEIRGLYDAGIYDGYITWLSSSNLEKYQTQKQAFQIDYRKEYLDE